VQKPHLKRNQQLVDTYKTFCEADGSKHISSEYAINKLNKIIQYFNINNILELGLGIGSISGTLLALNKNKMKLNYSGTEANEFCLRSLSTNLKKDFNRLEIFKDLSEIPVQKRFDLIIVDGEDLQLSKIVALINTRGIIAIEGDRTPQQQLLQKLFPNNKEIHCISLKKNKNYSPFPIKEWQGGLKVIFVKPTRQQYAWWIKEKIWTKIKYHYPGRYLGDKNPKHEE